MPAIYMENSDGTESLVPKSVDGNLVLVHAISRKFILRRGSDVLCIFNEAYDRVGINPDTNTTSPSVERVVKVQPDTSR
jgi:type IV secretion system protein VirB9